MTRDKEEEDVVAEEDGELENVESDDMSDEETLAGTATDVAFGLTAKEMDDMGDNEWKVFLQNTSSQLQMDAEALYSGSYGLTQAVRAFADRPLASLLFLFAEGTLAKDRNSWSEIKAAIWTIFCPHLQHRAMFTGIPPVWSISETTPSIDDFDHFISLRFKARTVTPWTDRDAERAMRRNRGSLWLQMGKSDRHQRTTCCI